MPAAAMGMMAAMMNQPPLVYDVVNKDGTGEESIYGKSFDDESFTLKHSARGLLSMANIGPNLCGLRSPLFKTDP